MAKGKKKKYVNSDMLYSPPPNNAWQQQSRNGDISVSVKGTENNRTGQTQTEYVAIDHTMTQAGMPTGRSTPKKEVTPISTGRT